MHGIPVKSVSLSFVVEKAIVLIDDTPKGFEIAAWVVIEFRFVYTRHETDGRQQGDECKKEVFEIHLTDLDEFEFLHDTDHNGMRVDMGFERIDMSLPKIA